VSGRSLLEVLGYLRRFISDMTSKDPMGREGVSPHLLFVSPRIITKKGIRPFSKRIFWFLRRGLVLEEK
jgi:hypothetical protein